MSRFHREDDCCRPSYCYVDPCEDRCHERRERESMRPAFGGLYAVFGQSIPITAGLVSQVPLPSIMPRMRVEYEPENSITIRERGVYEINFSIFFTLGVSLGQITQFSVMVRRNGTALSAGTVSWPLEDDVNSASLSILTHLREGDVIDLAVTADGNVPIILAAATGAALSVKRVE